MKKTACLPLLKPASVRAFRKQVYDYYEAHGRELPWRKKITPYKILISEVMLQQTQVERVIEKYKEFLSQFPDFFALAAAPPAKLLTIWSGMGYNRRALALHALARTIVNEYRGKLPSEQDKLLVLPGIGKYTAGAVMAFAYNKSVVFMDTNIRRVYIHEFFGDRDAIHDNELIPLVEKTLDTDNPRKWYNALMDYGAMLKQQLNPNRRSLHYTRQTPFRNSNRQARGKILKILLKKAPLRKQDIIKESNLDSIRVNAILIQLENEGFITKRGIYFEV